MTMPRSREQLAQAAAEAEEWLDNLDPDDPDQTVDDPADLRSIVHAVAALAAAEQSLAATVASARRNGRSWARVGSALGVSKQAAAKRYGDDLQPELPDVSARAPVVPRPQEASPPPRASAGAPAVRRVPTPARRDVRTGDESTYEVFRDSDGLYRYREVAAFTSPPFETEDAVYEAIEMMYMSRARANDEHARRNR